VKRKHKLILIIFGAVNLLFFCGLGGAAWWLTRSPTPAVTLIAMQPLSSATPTLIFQWTATPTLTPLPEIEGRPTRTPTPTRTPFPTRIPNTATPTPTVVSEPILLQNANFDVLMLNNIPGWEWDATINYIPGREYDPVTSYAEPMFMPADDPMRRIQGSTLKIETVRWLKFQTWIHQTITVPTGSLVTFQIKAGAFSSIDSIMVKAGVDPNGNGNCERARWGEELSINQDSGVVTLSSPRLTVGAEGRITVCFFAEPRYPDVNNAAFFDVAELKVILPPP